jgi:hypothetical protein
MVHTSHGPISVFVCGDQEKPALVTYSDVALNYMSCFQGLFFFSEAASLLFHNFCIYHIDAPGHELGAAAISSDVAIPTVDERRSSNVMRFMQVISRRYNLTEGLKKLQVQDTHICGRKLSISFSSSSHVCQNGQKIQCIG